MKKYNINNFMFGSIDDDGNFHPIEGVNFECEIPPIEITEQPEYEQVISTAGVEGTFKFELSPQMWMMFYEAFLAEMLKYFEGKLS